MPAPRAPYSPPDLPVPLDGRRDLRTSLLNEAVRLDLAGTHRRAAIVAAMADGPQAVRRVQEVVDPSDEGQAIPELAPTTGDAPAR